ncbi:hypothetical protein ABFP60_04695 [Clostridioides difficile]
MELNMDFQPKFYTKKIFLEKCINSSNKLILCFSEKDYNDFNFNKVIIKNIKNREEFICPFTKELPNTLIIDLSSIWPYFTDYEGSIYIDIESNNTPVTLVPILSSKNPTRSDNINIKTNFKWFIRALDNGELRLSSIVNKKI